MLREGAEGAKDGIDGEPHPVQPRRIRPAFGWSPLFRRQYERGQRRLGEVELRHQVAEHGRTLAYGRTRVRSPVGLGVESLALAIGMPSAPG
jgi:hypothetical protein